MNIHNNENDPFEDVFKDRFADFESEPDTQLWQKIEPKLPLDSTRKFPYWQTSAVVILLLLAGLWIYTEKGDDDVLTKSNKFQTKNLNQKTPNLNPLLSVSPQTTPKTNTLLLSVKTQTTKVGTQTTTRDNYSLITNPNTTIETSTVSLNEKEKNNSNKLNLFSVNNSNEKQERLNNNSVVSSVFSPLLPVSSQTSESEINDVKLSVKTQATTRESISILNKNVLITLDSKNYSLLKNYFKTPKLKFVIAPKKDDYFKERKPLEIYASVMPLLNYYTITPNGNDANYVHSIAVNNDENRLGFYTQAGAIFTLSDRFKLRTGLTFTKTNHSINYQIRTDSLIVQPSDKQGVDVSFEELKKTYSQSANYLGTKIEVQYIFLEGEALTHYLNVGLEGAYRLNGGKQFNGFANFAYGVTRRIGDNSYLFIEPTFSYSLNQQSDNNSFLLVKPNKIGFNIGVNFKIK